MNVSAQSFQTWFRNHKTGYLLGAVLLIGYAVIALKGPQGIQALVEKRHEIQRLTEQNTLRQHENERLKERIHRLEDNSSEQEMEIRKQLKLLRPGETTFILPDGPSDAHKDQPVSPAVPAQQP